MGIWPKISAVEYPHTVENNVQKNSGDFEFSVLDLVSLTIDVLFGFIRDHLGLYWGWVDPGILVLACFVLSERSSYLM